MTAEREVTATLVKGRDGCQGRKGWLLNILGGKAHQDLSVAWI